MYLSPKIYNFIVRPKFSINLYIKNIIKKEFNFKNKKVLDFGCGPGPISYIFEAKDYLGVDIDNRRIKSAKKSYPNYKFKTIRNNKIPAETNSIDYICIFATLHHMSDEILNKSIKEFKRVLKSTGKIIIIEPVLMEKYKFNNWFMNTFDDGDFIRDEKYYKKFFNKDFKIKVHKRFRKFLLYNEIFFSARKK